MILLISFTIHLPKQVDQAADHLISPSYGHLSLASEIARESR